MTTTAELKTISFELTERIMDTIPVNHLAFQKLLGLLEITATTDVPSAAVTVGPRSRLLLNPEFIDKHCQSDRALMMLVLHELHHILLGHTRLYDTTTTAHNFVFDAVINAQLCQSLPKPAYTALFRALYRADRFPEALLRPPVDWGTSQEQWFLKGAALEAHQALYSDTSASYDELFELLESSLDGSLDGSLKDFSGFKTERLLGNHDKPWQDSAADPDLLNGIRKIVSQWPAVEVCSGRDMGAEEDWQQRTPRQAQGQAIQIIHRALRTVTGTDQGNLGVPNPVMKPSESVLPYRTTPDRRAEVRTAMGVSSLLFRSQTDVWTPARSNQAHIYIDVSGSMNDLVPLLYGALHPLINHIHPEIHLFSTSLYDISPEQLRRGVVATDNGTDITCVTNHIITNRVRRALIITDGMVGHVPPEHRAKLRRQHTRLGVVLTEESFKQFAQEIGAKVFLLPSHII